MIYYRQCIHTKLIFRRTEKGSEEYSAKNREWIMTGEAIEAFHDSSGYRSISEEEAKKAIERQNKAYDNTK
jgi:DNA-binding PadR family transcriptional regulator